MKFKEKLKKNSVFVSWSPFFFSFFFRSDRLQRFDILESDRLGMPGHAPLESVPPFISRWFLRTRISMPYVNVQGEANGTRDFRLLAPPFSRRGQAHCPCSKPVSSFQAILLSFAARIEIKEWMEPRRKRVDAHARHTGQIQGEGVLHVFFFLHPKKGRNLPRLLCSLSITMGGDDQENRFVPTACLPIKTGRYESKPNYSCFFFSIRFIYQERNDRSRKKIEKKVTLGLQ